MPDTWITRVDTDATCRRITHDLAVIKGMVAVNLGLSLACLLLVWCL
jgi:hypothetical protein